jgi:glycine/D-amino acid oxidase-like deaminating enzyme/nitrite reductase/ring-hydroxylating ferredoxin subunit
MANEQVQDNSVWRQAAVPELPPLDRDAQCDVCVVGAGIAGLTTAYLLTRAGLKTLVIDMNQIGGGETGRTTAHLTHALDDRYFNLEKLHGQSGAQMAAASHTASIDLIESIVRAENIDCSFERLDGYLFLKPGDPADMLDRELEATHRVGLVAVEKIARAPLNSFDTGPALRFPQQAQIHPLKYLAGLTQAILQKGGKVFPNTRAKKITGGSSATITTFSGHTITAGAVVVATNTPINDLVTIHTKQAAYQTYVIGARVPAGSVPLALYWDTGDPYHYLRLHHLSNDFDLLIVGGEDHKTGQEENSEQCYSRLEAWTRERFPMIEGIEYRWSGEVMEPVDSLAFIGPNPSGEANVYIATGDSGNGMTHGTIAGMLLTDLLQGRQNTWAELYDPARVTPRAVKDFVKENLDTAVYLTDWVTGGTADEAAEIPHGAGAIVRRGLRKIAAYRDAAGTLHEHSAVCTHLGCIVHWNNAEQTWDCPCHGSRYDPYGKVIHGPANRDLAPIKASRQGAG